MRRQMSRQRARIRARRWRADDGHTLAELSVSIMIIGLVSAIAFTVFMSVQRVNTVVTDRNTTMGEGRFAMEHVSRTLRVATSQDGTLPPIVDARTNQITFYAALENSGRGSVRAVPTKVIYYFDAAKKCLMEDVTPGVQSGATRSWPVSGRRVRCVADTEVAPTFEYFDSTVIAAGGKPTSTLGTPPWVSPTNATTLKSIRSVLITIPVQKTTGRTTTFPATSLVVLDNVLS